MITDSKVAENLAANNAKTLIGHRRNVLTLAWNCTGTTLASGASDSTIKLWEVNQAGQTQESKALSGHTKSVNQLCWNPQDAHMLVTVSEDKTIRIWDTKALKCICNLDTNEEMINVAWSPDGKWIAAGNKGAKEDTVYFVEVSSMKMTFTPSFAFEVNEICWSPDSRYVLLAAALVGTNGPGKVEVFSVEDIRKNATQSSQLKPVFSCQSHTAACYCAKVDPTGRYMATGSADSLVTLWRLEEMTCVGSVPEFDFPTRALSFSHDGRYLAILDEDGTIGIISVSSGKLIASRRCHVSLNAIAFHPKSYMIAYAGDERDRDEGMIHVRGLHWD